MTKQHITRANLLALAAQSRVIDGATLESHGITRSVQARLVRNEWLQRLAPGLFVVGAVDWLAHVDAAVRIGGPPAAAYGTTDPAGADRTSDAAGAYNTSAPAAGCRAGHPAAAYGTTDPATAYRTRDLAAASDPAAAYLAGAQARTNNTPALAAAYATTALALFGVGEQRLPVHVLASSPAHLTPRPWAVFHRLNIGTRRIVDLDIPRVAFDDSVIDALGQLDELDAIALVTRVIQERRTTAARLLNVVHVRRRVAHRELVEKILRDGAGIESALEHTFAERVERAHNLERMDRQFIVPGTGHRADGAYPERRALIHLDGARYHDPEADRALDNYHAKLKYASFRFGWADCWSWPCRTAAVLADGPLPRRCRRCTS